MSDFINNLYAYEKEQGDNNNLISPAEIKEYLGKSGKSNELRNDTNNIKLFLDKSENVSKKTELKEVAMKILSGCDFDAQDKIGSAMVSLLFAIDHGKQLMADHNTYLASTVLPGSRYYTAQDYCNYLSKNKNNAPVVIENNNNLVRVSGLKIDRGTNGFVTCTYKKESTLLDVSSREVNKLKWLDIANCYLWKGSDGEIQASVSRPDFATMDNIDTTPSKETINLSSYTDLKDLDVKTLTTVADCNTKLGELQKAIDELKAHTDKANQAEINTLKATLLQKKTEVSAKKTELEKISSLQDIDLSSYDGLKNLDVATLSTIQTCDEKLTEIYSKQTELNKVDLTILTENSKTEVNVLKRTLAEKYSAVSTKKNELIAENTIDLSSYTDLKDLNTNTLITVADCNTKLGELQTAIDELGKNKGKVNQNDIDSLLATLTQKQTEINTILPKLQKKEHKDAEKNTIDLTKYQDMIDDDITNDSEKQLTKKQGKITDAVDELRAHENKTNQTDIYAMITSLNNKNTNIVDRLKTLELQEPMSLSLEQINSCNPYLDIRNKNISSKKDKIELKNGILEISTLIPPLTQGDKDKIFTGDVLQYSNFCNLMGEKLNNINKENLNENEKRILRDYYKTFIVIPDKLF